MCNCHKLGNALKTYRPNVALDGKTVRELIGHQTGTKPNIKYVTSRDYLLRKYINSPYYGDAINAAGADFVPNLGKIQQLTSIDNRLLVYGLSNMNKQVGNKLLMILVDTITSTYAPLITETTLDPDNHITVRAWQPNSHGYLKSGGNVASDLITRRGGSGGPPDIIKCQGQPFGNCFMCMMGLMTNTVLGAFALIVEGEFCAGAIAIHCMFLAPPVVFPFLSQGAIVNNGGFSF